MTQRKDYFALIVLIIIQLGLIMVLARLISAETDLLVESKHKLAAFEQKDASLVKLEKDFNLIGSDLEIINQALPNKDKILDLIAQIEKQASSSGIIAKIGFSQQAVQSESGGVKSLVFNLSLDGTYNQAIYFLKKMEKTPQVIMIDKINVQSPRGLETESKIVLTAKCYLDPNF